MVGGAPVSGSWANDIGADGYTEDAMGAVALAASGSMRRGRRGSRGRTRPESRAAPASGGPGSRPAASGRLRDRAALESCRRRAIARIHEATLDVIERVGVRFPSDRALDIWAAAGADSRPREPASSRRPRR